MGGKMENQTYLKQARRGIDPLRAFGFTNGDRLSNSRYYNASLKGWEVGADIQRSVLDWIKRPRNFLVYIGNRGVGKTYFVCALIWWFWEKGDEVYAIRAHDYFNRIHEDIS